MEWKIVHTGQHYDQTMPQAFSDNRGIPEPDYNLEAASALWLSGSPSEILIESVPESIPVDALELWGIDLSRDTFKNREVMKTRPVPLNEGDSSFDKL